MTKEKKKEYTSKMKFLIHNFFVQAEPVPDVGHIRAIDLYNIRGFDISNIKLNIFISSGLCVCP